MGVIWAHMGVNTVIVYGCVIFFAPRNAAGCTQLYYIQHGPYMGMNMCVHM